MLLNLYSVYDEKSEIYLPPFHGRHHNDAIRSFTQTVNSPGTPIGDHPADFNLIWIGKWEDDTGEGEFFDEPATLGNGVDFLRPERQNELYADLSEPQ